MMKTLLALVIALACVSIADAAPTRGNGNGRGVVVVRNSGFNHGGFNRGFAQRSFGGYGYGYGGAAFAPSYGYGYAQPLVVQQPLATFVAPAAPVQQFAEPVYAPTVVAPVQFAAPVYAPSFVPTYGYGGGYGYNTFRGTGYGVRGFGGQRSVIIRR